LGEVSHSPNYFMALPGVTGYRRHMSGWGPRRLVEKSQPPLLQQDASG